METSRRIHGQDWSRQWRSWLRTLGLTQSERGVRVKRLEVLPGRITATTQDRSGVTCEVEIRFVLWSDEQWQRVIDALGSQALYAAQLLAGDLPPDLDRAVTAAGVQLLPAGLGELEHRCTCDARLQPPCEHAAAVYLALGEMLADDPWLLFRLRGRDQQTILRGLRTQRARTGESAAGTPSIGRSGGSAASEGGFYRAPSVAASEEDILPLEQQIDRFWGSGKALGDFRPHIVPAPVELALLRRLGPPTTAAGSDTYERLVLLYRRISREAMTLAYASGPDNGTHDNGTHDNGDNGAAG